MKRIEEFKTWIEISKKAIENNLREFKKLLDPKVKLMSVVKSNAYGHGLIEFSNVANNFVDWLGVDSIDEGIILRQEKIKKPILILGYTLIKRLPDLIKYNIDQTVYNTETIKALGSLGKNNKKIIKIHLKIETGTNRQGILINELLPFAKLINRYPYLKIEGVATHFANIEDTTSPEFAQKQLTDFNKSIKILEKAGIKIPLKHSASSAAALIFPETHFNLIRLGFAQFGYWPSKETLISAKEKNNFISLQPVLSWKTKVAQTKKAQAGMTVSYGRTEKLSRDSKIAILPIGYWDGFDRKLSSIGNVLIHGQRAKVLGRVCMNMIVVDITDIKKVNLEDEVVILGKQKKEFISPDEIANKIGTINYEILSRINPLIPRLIVE